MRSSSEVKAAAREWARLNGIEIDGDGYVVRLEDNLWAPMNESTSRDFFAGSGSELGGNGLRGKMQALHSSSALACNVFDFWRARPTRAPLGRVLGLESEIESLRFEGQFATGLRGTKPNLDVVIEFRDALIGIESKFLEPFGSMAPYRSFSESYFRDGRTLWADVGLPGCQRLAEGIADGEYVFRCLDAPQLLKHLLGLRRNHGPKASLRYLYFELEGDLGDTHAKELAAFERLVGAEAGVRAQSYQDLIGRLEREVGLSSEVEYVRYLKARYVEAKGGSDDV